MNISSLCDQLLTTSESLLLNNNNNNKKKTTDKTDEEVFEELSLLLLLLKKKNRMKLQQYDQKQQTIEQIKDNINQSQLKLENLLYKQAYLLREIRDNCDYNSIELSKIEDELSMKIGMDEYDESQGEEGRDNMNEKHKNCLLLLKNEMTKRKLKRKELNNFIKEKEYLVSELSNKRKKLESFPEKTEKIKTLAFDLFATSCESQGEVTVPQLPVVESKALQEVQKLPNSLYTLYHSLHSLSSDELMKIKVNIVEDKKEKNWGVEVVLTLNKMRLSTTNDEKKEDNDENIASITLLFHCCSITNLVVVKLTSLQLQSNEGNGGKTSILSPPNIMKQNFLKSLFPKQPASIDLIQTYKKSESSDYTSGVEGEAFLWVQWICGVRTLPPPETKTAFAVESNEMFYSLNTVIDAVR